MFSFKLNNKSSTNKYCLSNALKSFTSLRQMFLVDWQVSTCGNSIALKSKDWKIWIRARTTDTYYKFDCITESADSFLKRELQSIKSTPLNNSHEFNFKGDRPQRHTWSNTHQTKFTNKKLHILILTATDMIVPRKTLVVWSWYDNITHNNLIRI